MNPKTTELIIRIVSMPLLILIGIKIRNLITDGILSRAKGKKNTKLDEQCEKNYKAMNTKIDG